MPLNDEIIAARIEVRICELRLLAAETFVQLARQSPRADLLAPPYPVALPHRGAMRMISFPSVPNGPRASRAR